MSKKTAFNTAVNSVVERLNSHADLAAKVEEWAGLVVEGRLSEAEKMFDAFCRELYKIRWNDYNNLVDAFGKYMKS